MNVLWLAGLFLCSFVLTGLWRWHALRISMLDIPNARSSHTLPTPRGGGIGLVLAFLTGGGMLVWSSDASEPMLGAMLRSASLIAIVGFIDDHYHVPVVLRLVLHTAASLFFLYNVPVTYDMSCMLRDISFSKVVCLATVIALVWMLNLYNFMDGIDGLAGGEAVSIAFGGALILWIDGCYDPYGPWLLVLGFAAAGFLVWNWPQAKIFMGDVGSGFVGFVFGCFALLTSMQQGINIWAWLILLGIFIIDATVTLLRRLLRKECFWQAHRSHAYQILSRRYQSHAKVTVEIVLVNVFWLLPWAILSARFSMYAPLCALMALGPLICYVVMVGAGTTDD